MLTDTQLAEILDRIDWGLDHWRDRAKLRQHITELNTHLDAQDKRIVEQGAELATQRATIASLRAEVEAHDAALQQQDAARSQWHTIQVRRVPVIWTVTGDDARVVFYEAVETRTNGNGKAA